VKIALTINGVEYSSAAGIGSTLGAHQTYKLTSAADPNQFVNFTTGSSTIVIDSAEKALAVEAALKTAFGATAGSSALNFQIGSDSTDVLSVSIGSAQTSSLFDGKSLNVLTQASATIASTQLDKALQAVTTLRASVGALQSRFNYAAANIQIAVQNQDAARSALLDTDVAAESTNYATSQVKLQAGISVLAQANQQLQNLLKLIQ
jgi:flagellin-like hook-associated protein FlgL